MPEIELSAGTIEYDDTSGNGPVVVLMPGLAMDASLWRHVVRELRGDFRCIVPTLPLGGHRLPMRPGADLSPRGIGRLEAEFIERLDLHHVTLVGNDSGLFQFNPNTWLTTPYANEDIFDPRASALAAGWMWSVGRRNEWVCQ